MVTPMRDDGDGDNDALIDGMIDKTNLDGDGLNDNGSSFEAAYGTPTRKDGMTGKQPKSAALSGNLSAKFQAMTAGFQAARKGKGM